MNPEIEALLSVYQRRLNDVTAQAIAYEARIQILSQQLQQLQAQLQEEKPKKYVKKPEVNEF
jgi:prefoldin subunit 5